MTFTNAWDETAPVGSALVSTVDEIIRQLKLDLRERFASSSANFDGGRVALASPAVTSGSPNLLKVTGPAHIGLTAGAEAVDILIDLARTVTFLTGALATQRAFHIKAPTYAFATASTLTTAASLAVSGAPAAGTNATITNAYALLIEAGLSKFLGGIRIENPTEASIPLTVNHDPSGTITSKILELLEKDTARFSFHPNELTDGAPLDLDDFDNGSGLGRFVDVGRNSNASTPAPAFLKLADKAGTSYYIWFDSSGILRKGTSAPTNTDTGGSPAFSTVYGGSVGSGPSGNTIYACASGYTTTTNVDVYDIVVPKSGFLKNLYIWTSGSSTLTVTVRINGVASTLTCSTSSSTSANDTSHVPAISAGDRISITIYAAGNMSAYQVAWGFELVM